MKQPRVLSIACATLVAGCATLHNRVISSHDRDAWEVAQRHAAIIDNPSASGALTTAGQQDTDNAVVAVSSYTSESLCFSVDGDSQTLWPQVTGFDALVLADAGQMESSATVEADGAQRTLRTHTRPRTDTWKTGSGDPELHTVMAAYEERAVCFDHPTLLVPSAAELVLRARFRDGSHGYFVWHLNRAASR